MHKLVGRHYDEIKHKTQLVDDVTRPVITSRGVPLCFTPHQDYLTYIKTVRLGIVKETPIPGCLYGVTRPLYE